MIRNVLIADGGGGEPYRGHLGIDGDAIAFVGRGEGAGRRSEAGGGARGEAGRDFDGRGLLLAPGFIDMHSHSDLGLLTAPFAANKLAQGVTTEVAGNCGFSLFPILDEGRPAVRRLMQAYGKEMELPWSRGSQFYRIAEERGFGTNYLPLVGHGLLRLSVMGFSSQPAGEAELEAMAALLEEELEAGAWGFSTGLGYMPGCFADQRELRHLAAVAARRGGIYTSHIRNQGAGLLEAVEEAIGLARETGIKVVLSHLKAYGPANWGNAAAALERIAAARKEGLAVIADFYPYDSSESTLMYELPEWVKEGGVDRMLERLRDPDVQGRIAEELEAAGELSWERVIISGVRSSANRPLIGTSIAELAGQRGIEPIEAVCNLLAEEEGAVSTICRLMSDADLREIAAAPFTVLGSDAYAQPEGEPFTGHPRNFGAFPRFYRRFVREEKLLTPGQGVRKMSAAAAEFLGLRERGSLRPGCTADLVLFDPERFSDRASYREPSLAPEGLAAVWVNGRLQYDRGELQRRPAGRVLRRQMAGESGGEPAGKSAEKSAGEPAGKPAGRGAALREGGE
jgi:N-acyl-D-aspartate/D-glutamate deacylase